MATELEPTPSCVCGFPSEKRGKYDLSPPTNSLTSENSSIPLGTLTLSSSVPQSTGIHILHTWNNINVCLFKSGFPAILFENRQPFASRGLKHPSSCWRRGTWAITHPWSLFSSISSFGQGEYSPRDTPAWKWSWVGFKCKQMQAFRKFERPPSFSLHFAIFLPRWCGWKIIHNIYAQRFQQHTGMRNAIAMIVQSNHKEKSSFSPPEMEISGKGMLAEDSPFWDSDWD